MTHAIRFHKTGGPEVLVWEEVAGRQARPGRGAHPPHRGRSELRRHLQPLRASIRRSCRAGSAARRAGVVEEVGAGVTDLKPGDRVAYGGAPIGAYAEARLIPADRLLKLPDGIDDKTAAAMMLKGLTTQYLIRQTYRVKAGDTILLHAAAGGVGLILGQWAKHLGATVIGTVGSDEKAKLAKAHGCDHTIVYTQRGFREARRRDHRRQEGAGGLRFRRQGHVPEIARLPGAARRRRAVRRSPPARSIRSTSACWRRRDRST